MLYAPVNNFSGMWGGFPGLNQYKAVTLKCHAQGHIQLMHSFDINIRICQPENSEHHFRGLTNPDVNRKRMHQLFCYMTLSLFS